MSVRGENEAPVFVTQPVTEVFTDGQYSYLASATDTEDLVTYSLVEGPVGMLVSEATGAVSWTPESLQPGDLVSVTIRATDQRGASSDQTFEITVVPDTEAPNVSISIPAGAVFDLGQPIEITVNVIDDSPIADLDVTIDGQAVALNSENQFTYTPTSSSLPVIEVIATDSSGNVSVTEQRLRVLDPNDVTGPEVNIDSPAINSQVTYLTDVAITVNADDLFDWQLEYSLKDSGVWTELASGTNEVNNEVVATFDPTLLRNDQYDIRVSATDTSAVSYTHLTLPTNREV